VPVLHPRIKKISRPAGASLIALIAVTTVGCATTSFSENTQTITGQYLTGRLAARTHDHALAASRYDEVQNVVPGAQNLREQNFRYHLLNGDVARAVDHAKKLQLINLPENVEKDARAVGLISLTIASDHIKAGRYAAARKELATIKKNSLYGTAAFLLTGWAIEGDEGPRAAISFFNAAPPDQFTGFNSLHQALLADKAGNSEAARASYELAFVTLGGPIGQRAFTAFLEREGDEKASREINELLVKQQGPMRRLGLQKLERLEKGRKSNQFKNTTPAEGAAIALFNFATAITEQIFSQRSAAENAGFQLNEPDLNPTLSLVQLALSLDPDLDEVLRFEGALNNIYNQHDAAIAAFSKVKPQSSYYEQSRIEMAAAYDAMDETEKSLTVLRDLIKIDPDAIDARLVLGAGLSGEDRHEEAIEVLTPAIQAFDKISYSNSWRFYIARANALIELDRWPEAEIDLKKSVEIAPEEPTALNFLGYSWAERGIHLEEAFAMLEKAIEKEPRSGAITDSVGWAHYQLGDYDKAVVQLEKASSLEPADPTIIDHLGDAYWRLDRKIEAKYQWRHALELEPDEKLRAKINEKLNSGLEALPVSKNTGQDHEVVKTQPAKPQTD